MKVVYNSILQNIQGKKVLFLFLLTNTVYVAMLMLTIPKVMIFSKGMRLLDMQPMGYDFEYVHLLFQNLGPEGRHAYLHQQLPLDMVYPLLFGVSYCLVLAYFLNKLNKLKPLFIYGCLLPLVVGMADYGENFGILFLLNSYPEISYSSVTITSSFTLVKSMGTTLYFVILIGVFLQFAVKFFRNKH
ncbi:hypothetical protein [Zobellia roscoffensis]|uniref:hypothetical protein n=1 Tax=Zobellia roscoffensis TaxID=2779508 RepID=UPI00188A1BA7|nr:hypothetical protein [Zobellia roscoffensis]